MKTGRVLNGTYLDKDNNLVNPFDSFKDMTLKKQMVRLKLYHCLMNLMDQL